MSFKCGKTGFFSSILIGLYAVTCLKIVLIYKIPAIYCFSVRSELKVGAPWEVLLWLLRLRWRFRVVGDSMLPLLKPGDEVLVNPRAYKRISPQPGDIVVAQHPYHTNLRLIKRVVSVVENERYFLEGDNPLESSDSRMFGAVAAEQILGQVTSRFS